MEELTMHSAKNLLALLSVRIKNWSTYRFDFFASILGMALPVGGLSLYWLATLNNIAIDDFIFTPKTIIIYYVIAYAIDLIFSYELAFSVEEDISTGRMNSFLLLPCNYLTVKLAEFLGNNLIPLCILVALIIVIIVTSVISISVITISVFLLFLIMGILFHFIYVMILGLLTVWMKNINGMLYFFQTITGLLSGTIIPLNLLPDHLKWLKWNPFSLSVFIPSETLLTGKNDIWALFALALWCIALYTVYRIIWTCTMRSYQAYGG
jgi:ABC-2 type transport system permease protein